MIKPGLCCIHLGLQKNGIKFQTMTWKKFSSMKYSDALKELSHRILNNVKTTSHILEDCGKRGWNYRASSDMFPCFTHPDANFNNDINNLMFVDEIKSEFKKCSNIIKQYNIRVSMHPGQFTVLCSANPKTVKASIRDLNMHSMLLDLMETESSYKFPINIHMGLYKGVLSEIADRFVDGWNQLNQSAKNRLVIECEDKANSWSVTELIDILQKRISIPLTFDYHHHKLNNKGLTEKEAFKLCFDTWNKTKPLFHYSESIIGEKNPRAHADFALNKPNDYGLDIDVDWELKGKDLAIEKMFT